MNVNTPAFARISSTIVCSGLLLGFASYASAEQGDAQAMRGIRVEGTLEEPATYAPKRSTAGTRTDTPLIEVPQAITVISAQQIADQNAQDIQAVLRYAPGVRAEMYGLDNRGDWFTLRGGSSGSTLLDGLRLPLTGWYGVVRNEPYAYERVEVLRGPSSVIAGQNGPGGVVNLVSKRPQGEAMRELAVQLGEDEHRLLAVDSTGPLDTDGTWLYRFVALARESDTQVEYAGHERIYVAPAFTWHAAETTTLSFYAQYQEDESRNTEGFFPWAGTLYPAPNGRIPMDTFVGEPDWDTYGGERVRAGYELEQRLAEGWKLQHRVRYDRIEGELRSMYANFRQVDAQGNGYGANALGPNRTIGRTWYATDNSARIWAADLFLHGHLSFGNVEHTLALGVDAMRNDDEQASLNGAATPLDVYAPVYGTFPLPALNFGPPVATETRQLGILLQDQMKIAERFVVVASLRHDDARTSVAGSPDQGSDDSAWTKRLGAVWLAGGGWAPYVSYSESFEPVGGVTRNDAAFDPKRGRQYEAGLRWQPAGIGFSASAAAYHLTEDNRLGPDPIDPRFSVQLGEVTVEGAELEAAASLAAWDFIASYTYSDARITASSRQNDPQLDEQLASIPEHSASLWAVHRLEHFNLPRLRVGAGVRYVGETWDGTGTLRTPSNTVFDALVSLDQGAWRFSLNATNLLDEEYVATCLTRGDCWYGTRRKVVASATYYW